MDPSSPFRRLPAGIEILGTQQQQQDQRHLLHQFPDEMWTALSRLCCDTNSELHQVSAADGRIVVALADSVNIIEETSGFGDEEEEEEEEEHGRELKKLDDSVFSSGGGGQDMQQQQHHIIKLGPQFSMWPTRHSTVGTQTIMSQTAMQMKPSGRFLLQPQMPKELMMEPGLGSSLMHLHHLPSIRSSAGSGGAGGGGKLDLPTQIWRLFQRGKFCDFTVYTNNTDSHRCHKAVLCLLSDYFQDLLLMGARQEGLPHPAAAALAGDESRISLDQSWMSTEMFRAFLGWCYAADAEEAAHLINEESVACLSVCAMRLGAQELKQQCYQFISTVTHHEASGTVQQQQVPKVTTLTGTQQQPTRHPVLGKWTPPENKETIITSGSGHHHQQGYLMGQQDTDDPYCRHRYNKAQITRQQQLPCPPDDNIDPPGLLPMMTSYCRDEPGTLADGTCGYNSCCWRPGLNAAAAAAPKIFSRDEGDNGNKPPKWMHRNKSTHPGCGPCCSHQQQKVGQHILGFCRQHHQQHQEKQLQQHQQHSSPAGTIYHSASSGVIYSGCVRNATGSGGGGAIMRGTDELAAAATEGNNEAWLHPPLADGACHSCSCCCLCEDQQGNNCYANNDLNDIKARVKQDSSLSGVGDGAAMSSLAVLEESVLKEAARVFGRDKDPRVRRRIPAGSVGSPKRHPNNRNLIPICSEDGKVLLNTSLNGMDNVGQLFVQDLPPLSQQQQQQQMRTTTTMTRNTNIIISNDDEGNNNHHQHQASMMMRMSDCSSRSIIRSNHSACCTGLPEVIQFLMKDNPSVLVLGGMNPMMGLGFTAETASYVLQYFPHLERWWGITRLPEPRVHFAAVFFDGCVYVVGGAVPLLVPDDGYNTKATPSQKCWRFHPSQGTWDMLSDMPEARMHHSLLVFRGKIYVIGGIGSDNQILSTVIRLNPNKRAPIWEKFHPISAPRFALAATYFKGMMWAIGGITTNLKPTTRVECYHPKQKKWIEGPGLQCPRGFLQVAHTERKLFIIGGAGRQQSSASTASSTGATPCGPSPSAATNSHNKDQQHKQRSRLPSSALHQLLSSRMHAVSTVDVWDNDTEDWVFDLEMDVPCHGHAVVALGGEEFLVIGGMTCKSAHVMQRVAKFNATNRKWHQLQPLPYGLTGHAAVLLPPIAPSSRRRCN